MFKTHYDAKDEHALNDHTLEPDEISPTGKRYDAYYQMEAEALQRLVDSMKRDNIIYIKGVAYQIESYTEAASDGSRKATLRLYRPF